MAIYRRESANADLKLGDESVEKAKGAENDRLGRGFDSLTGDNTPAEKKPRVVRHGVYDGPKPLVKERPPLRETPGVGGRVVIRTDVLPKEPLRSARSARKGTTVLVRTERTDPPKRYKTSEPISAHNRYNVRSDKPIVIDPRKKK